MFRWCSYLGVPFSYQQHGIVIAVEGGDEKESNETAGSSDNIGGQNITIVNFDHQQDNVEKEKNRCASTVQIIDQDKNQAEWEQVQYSETEWHKRLSSRAGTCCPDNADPVAVVMSRIRFLQVHSDVMITSLQYDTHKRNGECIAIWCKTGVYKSLAGSAKMLYTTYRSTNTAAGAMQSSNIAVSVSVLQSSISCRVVLIKMQ